jgi:hypothetical protein
MSNKDIVGIEKEKKETCILTPICCKYCRRFTTYIELDFVFHLDEADHIGRGYLVS